jgi:hypothetical protein
MGSQQVIDQLQESKKNKTSLYWRSELLAENPKSFLDTEQWPETDSSFFELKLMFIDLTIDLDHSRQTLVASIGCWLLSHREKTFLYVKSKPLTLLQLEEHAQDTSIDLKSSPPKAMSGMFAAVLSQKDGLGKLSPTIQPESTTLSLNMHYQDLNSSGTLSLTIASQSRVDPPVFGPLYNEIIAHPRKPLPQENITHEHALDKAHQEWIQAKPSSQTAKKSAVNSQRYKYAQIKKRKLSKKIKGFAKKSKK